MSWRRIRRPISLRETLALHRLRLPSARRRVNTRSVALAVWALVGIFAAFVMGYWAYARVMKVEAMPMLNFLSLFVLLGVGADDVLILTDTFRLVTAEDPERSVTARMHDALTIAGSAMLVTSVTSAASFYANLVSALPALRSFGVFMGTVIVTNSSRSVAAWGGAAARGGGARRRRRRRGGARRRSRPGRWRSRRRSRAAARGGAGAGAAARGGGSAR